MFHRFEKGFALVSSRTVTVAMCLLLVVSLLVACGSNEENNQSASVQSSSAPTESIAPTSSTVPTASVAPTSEVKSSLTVTDELGHEVTIPADPKRIYAPYLEDSLLKLGIKPIAQWGSGTWVQEYLQEDLKDVPKLDFTGGVPPSPEALLSYTPDFIVLHTANYAQNGVYENYSKIAPTYVFKNASGDVEKSLTTLGGLLGKTAEADAAVQAYHQKVTDAKEKIAKVAEGKKIAIIRFNAKEGINLMGGNYLCGYVVHQVLGFGKNKLVETENGASLSMEVLPDLDADYIFMINPSGLGTELMKTTTESPIWQSVPAVKAGHAYEVDNKYWLGSGLTAYEKIIDDVVSMVSK